MGTNIFDSTTLIKKKKCLGQVEISPEDGEFITMDKIEEEEDSDEEINLIR